MSSQSTVRLVWLEPGQDFPPLQTCWGPQDPAPGLLAAGSDLRVGTLLKAYSQGIFPWYSEKQPVLWWSPDPRTVLDIHNFRLHRSLRKTIGRFIATPGCEIRIDHDFGATIRACAQVPRHEQSGTWIVGDMQAAYIALHHAGHAHSVETWIDGKLVGGLYCTAIGRAVFGESMFSRQTDASKVALAALVAFARANRITHIDCQQHTTHLASFGASPMGREAFCQHIRDATRQTEPPIQWHFEPVHWLQLDPRLVP